MAELFFPLRYMEMYVRRTYRCQSTMNHIGRNSVRFSAFLVNMYQSAVAIITNARRNTFRNDPATCILSDMHHFSAGIGLLVDY